MCHNNRSVRYSTYEQVTMEDSYVETKVEALEGNRAKVTITLDAKDVDARIKNTYKEFANKYNFPGFRKGKAPRPIIDNALGAEAVRATVTDDVVNGTYPLAIDDCDLYPIAKPEFDETDLVEAGKPYTFSFTVTVKPEIEISSYEPVEIELPAEGTTDAEIDEQIDKVKANYDTDEKWQAALDQAGMTEDSYRAEIEQKLKENKLYASFASDEDPSDADMLQYAQMYATAYDGSKRSSHILFNSDDEATAQEVLDKLNSGELDFVDAVKEYSQDPGSVERDGDVGWNNPSNLAKEYKDGLEPLEKGQLSGLVTTQFGIHIIKCTDVYKAPEEVTSLDQIPEEWISVIASSLKSTKQQEAYKKWLDETTEAADIKINDMPQGLPYDVDMSKYPAPNADSGATDGTQEGSTDGAEGGEAADGASADGTDAPASEDQAATDGADSSEGNADTAAGDNASEQPAEAA